MKNIPVINLQKDIVPSTCGIRHNIHNRYSFSLQRSFLSNDRLTVRLTANSLFHKRQHFETRTVQGDVLGWSDTINKQNGRWFRVSVSYRFGKLKTSVKKTETTINNDDEVGGIVKGQM